MKRKAEQIVLTRAKEKIMQKAKDKSKDIIGKEGKRIHKVITMNFRFQNVLIFMLC